MDFSLNWAYWHIHKCDFISCDRRLLRTWICNMQMHARGGRNVEYLNIESNNVEYIRNSKILDHSDSRKREFSEWALDISLWTLHVKEIIRNFYQNLKMEQNLKNFSPLASIDTTGEPLFWAFIYSIEYVWASSCDSL